MPAALAWYREFVPCEALRADVYAFFSFVPAPLRAPGRALLRDVGFDRASFSSPQFADGHVSLVFELGRTCDANGHWVADATGCRGTVIGPMSEVGRTEGVDTPEMIGVYFRAAQVDRFLRVPLSDLTDRAVAVEDVWGSRATGLGAELRELDELRRIERLESALLARLAAGGRPSSSVDVAQLTDYVVRRRGRETVESLAREAGISRQHLSRLFRERVGIGPKLYCRLARFQAGLEYAGSGRADWAQVAAELGYADQSHMIAEFRQFSSLTPHALASRHWFHPFIERARRG
jgi:AraC-like DNA-binding protein